MPWEACKGQILRNVLITHHNPPSCRSMEAATEVLHSFCMNYAGMLSHLMLARWKYVNGKCLVARSVLVTTAQCACVARGVDKHVCYISHCLMLLEGLIGLHTCKVPHAVCLVLRNMLYTA